MNKSNSDIIIESFDIKIENKKIYDNATLKI
jgi:hypothetical protein